VDRPLQPGDRVEICRPLRTDPRDLRRMLQASGQVMGGSKSGAAK
jgi:putative ubiquitin-RnfH superfamily antitoxin RatB of RatAB toxin-antitoxin module